MTGKEKRYNILGYQAVSLFIVGILIAVLFQYSSMKTLTYFKNNENWFPINGFSPSNMNSCTIILGAKLVGPGHPLIDPLAALSGARHLFINYFLNQTNYGIIEGGFIATNYGYRGVSTAHVKLSAWDLGGLQWKISVHQCPEFIQCLQMKTTEYHHSSLPYHFLFGPNSNSFIWWIFNQCSIELTPVFSKYPFVGIDYFSSLKI